MKDNIMNKVKIKLKDLQSIIDSGLQPYLDTPSGLEKITDTYIKYGTGFLYKFDDDSELKCAVNHKMYIDEKNDFVDAANINIDHFIGNKKIINKQFIPYQQWIDFTVDSDHESYIHKGIIHHNSGKSMIIYCIIRWILQNETEGRILLLVPNVQLVNQMYSDFCDYSTQNGFDVSQHAQKLYSGQTKELTKRILITTWQSFVKISKDKINGPKIMALYKCVISDEAHGAKATETKNILENCINASYRIGTTGTIDTSVNAKVNVLQIEGYLGPVYKVTTTKTLIDKGEVSQLDIKTLVLEYQEEERKLIKKMSYAEEIEWLITNPKRNKILSKLALVSNGTTIILCKHRDAHAKVLYEHLSSVSDRPVYYIAGDVAANVREDIRKIANTTDCIIVATYQTMSTGVSIPNLRNVIFACPSKSCITVLQSIGRGLRLHEGKDKMILYDIIDDLKYKKSENFSYQHGEERINIYTKQKFNVNINSIAL